MDKQPQANSPEPIETKTIATLQFLTGKHIGRVIPLKDPMLRIGKPGEGVAVIARRKEGFVITVLEDEELVMLNQDVIGKRSLTLKDGDTLSLHKTSMQFYLCDKSS